MYRKVYLSLTLALSSILNAGSLKKPIESEYEPTTREKLPIVYRKEYTPNLGAGVMWIAKHMHAFDANKYKKVYDHLRNRCHIKEDQFYIPGYALQEQLEQVHDHNYLSRLFDTSEEKARILEVPQLRSLPNWWVNTGILDPMRYATAGTVLAVQKAREHGYAINLSGGYHHAEYDKGMGFCALGDIQLAVEELRKEQPDANVLIVDLDAHQGNGYEAYYSHQHHGNHKRPRIFDMYNANIFPRRHGVKDVIDQDVMLLKRERSADDSTDSNYLDTLRNHFSSYLDQLEQQGEKPDMIIYNAGTDTYYQDNVGHLNMSHNGIVQRDRYIWDQAHQRNIPITMLLSGGYTRQSAEIIKDSIRKVLKDRGVIRKRSAS